MLATRKHTIEAVLTRRNGAITLTKDKYDDDDTYEPLAAPAAGSVLCENPGCEVFLSIKNVADGDVCCSEQCEREYMYADLDDLWDDPDDVGDETDDGDM